MKRASQNQYPLYDSSWRHRSATTILRCQQQHGKIISEINRLQSYSWRLLRECWL